MKSEEQEKMRRSRDGQEKNLCLLGYTPPEPLPILSLSIHKLLRSAWGTLQALSVTPLNQV